MSRGAQIGAAGDPVVLANDALLRGDFLEAYDIAMSAREEGASDQQLDYCAVLSLARMGDTHMALDLYESSGLGDSTDDDFLALRGRLMKDLAEKAPEREQAALFASASEAYRAVYDSKGGYFPAINAATTALLAGDEEAAKRLAARVLGDGDIRKPVGYYSAATAAEAHILLDEPDEAYSAMEAAISWSDAGAGPRASTFRQMMLIARILPDRAEQIAPLLELLRPSPVLIYAGHMFREDADVEGSLASKIETELDRLRPNTAYGALACGADILIAEAVLRRGLELHLVFPFELEDFVAQSVRPGGEGWIRRFEACLHDAAGVSFATDMEYIGDPGLFRYGSSVAMGLAQMRAGHLRTSAVQLAILEEDAEAKAAGTAADLAMWKNLGHDSHIIRPGNIDRQLDHPPAVDAPKNTTRVAHSMIFADFAGFSSLSEAVLPLFADGVLGPIGRVLDEFGEKVLYRNSWGDALYAVIATPIDAAELALRLQMELSELPEQLTGDAAQYGMRIGVHHGPIYRGYDGVMKRDSFYGTEVTRTARIEPVTPTGEVYATEAFAAILSLETERKYGTHYVGKVQLAKGYGELAMYKLSRLGGDSE